NLTKKSKGASAETWTYTYDNLNHLLTAKRAATDGGAVNLEVDYQYDPLNNRSERDYDDDGAGPHAASVTKFLMDRGNAWADTDGSGSLQMRRLYTDAADAVSARIDSGGTAAWYLPDRLGSVRDIENLAGTAVLDHLDYDGWGNVVSESNAA